ncbi:MAG: hypothetical protein AB7J46_01560 [Candidatus Altimarinota bacterium]
MKSLLKNFSILFLGVSLTLFSVYLLPSTIKSVTAQLSTTTVLPFQDIYATINQYPKYQNIKNAAVPYGLPAITLNTPSNNFAAPFQIDMNGDGLLDIVYSSIGNGSYGAGTIGTQFVLINNGSGFEIGYSCKRDYKTTSYSSAGSQFLDYIYYQGTCADTSSTQYP